MKKVGEYIVTIYGHGYIEKVTTTKTGKVIYSVRDDEGKLHKWSAASTI